MNIEKREQLQKYVAENKYYSGCIWYLAPRFGKIKTTFNLCYYKNFTNILVLAPRTEIFDSWKKDKEFFNFSSNLSFATFDRCKKPITEKYDLVVVDEIHEASIKELEAIYEVIRNRESLALTGTMTNKTKNNILYKTGMTVSYEYLIPQAVKDGILSDYEINIHTISLNSTQNIVKTTKGLVSEKKRYEQLTWLKDKLTNEQKPTFFIDLKIMSLLQNSLAKKEKTIQLLKKYQNERILVFCGLTEIADSLNIPSYHSKNKDIETFKSFCEGNGNHMATIKLAQSGVTIKPINRGLVNYMSGNPEDSAQKICRFLGIEYGNPDKKAIIDIIVSDTDFEKDRLKTALMFFEEDKIKY